MSATIEVAVALSSRPLPFRRWARRRGAVGRMDDAASAGHDQRPKRLPSTVYSRLWPNNAAGVTPRSAPVSSMVSTTPTWLRRCAISKLYNKESAPVPGFINLTVSPGGIIDPESAIGMTYSSGTSVAVTTGVAHADATAPAANEVVLNLFYK